MNKKTLIIVILAAVCFTAMFPCTGNSAEVQYPMTVSQVNKVFLDLEAKYPSLIEHDVIWNFSTGSKPLYIFKIGNLDGKKVMFDGACHGNEISATGVLIEYAKWLLTSGDMTAKYILSVDLTIIIPVVNVDGYPYSRKNANGVDLNRNFAWNWNASASTGGGVSDNPNSSFYRGLYPASEKETRNYVTVFAKYRPSQYMNCHSLGSYQMWYTPKIAGSVLTQEKEIYLKYRAFSVTMNQSYAGIYSDGGTGNYPGCAYWTYGIKSWSGEITSRTVPYSELPLTKWLQWFVTLSLSA